MKLGTKVAGSKGSVGGRTAPDEGGLEFAPLAMPEVGGRRSSLQRGLLAVVHVSTIVASEHEWELETGGVAGEPQFASTVPWTGVVEVLLPLTSGRAGDDVGGASDWKRSRSS